MKKGVLISGFILIVILIVNLGLIFAADCSGDYIYDGKLCSQTYINGVQLNTNDCVCTGVCNVCVACDDISGAHRVCEKSNLGCTLGCVYYRDSDGDGYGNLTDNRSTSASGYVVMDNSDCDDLNNSIHTGAAEICDNKDNNCDGQTDEANACLCSSRFRVSAQTGTKAQMPGICSAYGDGWSWANITSQQEMDTVKYYFSGLGINSLIVSNPYSDSFTASKKCANEDSFNEPLKAVQIQTTSSPVPCFGDLPDAGLFGLCEYTGASVELCNSIDDDCDSVIDEDACSSLNQTYWANLNSKYNSVSSAGTGDTILLVVPGANLENKYINYTVKEKNSLLGADWLWPDYKIAQFSNLGYSSWTANYAGTFYFLAKVSEKENRSNDMLVSSASGGGGGGGGSGDATPVAVISSPANDYLASPNYPIQFSHSSSDEDDLLKIIWNFGDGASESYENYSLALTPGLGNTSHSYTSPGTYTAALTASEMFRQKSSSASVNIHVLKPGINVLSIISSPTKGVAYGNWVSFNASRSTVLNCSLGVCPSSSCIAVGNLNCSYIHAPLKKTILASENYDLRMNWTVYDNQGRMQPGFPRIGSWNNYSYIVDFPVYFEQAQTRNAVLSITYVSP